MRRVWSMNPSLSLRLSTDPQSPFPFHAIRRDEMFHRVRAALNTSLTALTRKDEGSRRRRCRAARVRELIKKSRAFLAPRTSPRSITSSTSRKGETRERRDIEKHLTCLTLACHVEHNTPNNRATPALLSARDNFSGGVTPRAVTTPPAPAYRPVPRPTKFYNPPTC